MGGLKWWSCSGGVAIWWVEILKAEEEEDSWEVMKKKSVTL